MDSARPSSPSNLLNLNEAADYIDVSVDVLLAWNEHDILKPTITSSGQVAYTREQLDKFKAIQNNNNLISRENSQMQTTLPINSFNSNGYSSPDKQLNSDQNNFSQINNYNFYSKSLNHPNEIKASISLKKVVLTFSFFAVALIIITITQQSKINSLLHQDIKNEIAYDSTNSTIRTLNDEETNVKNSSLNNEANNTENNSSNLDEAYNSKSISPSISKNNKDDNLLLESVLGNKNANNKSLNNIKNEIVTYGQKANLRTSSSCPECTDKSDLVNTVFDTEGNIKVSKNDPSEKELLATALGVSGLSQSQSLVRQSTNTAGIFTFLILGLLFIYFIYSSRRQFLPASNNLNNMALQPTSYTQNDIEWEKILEVDQKTDGSVVIIFQSKDYKVSKPELDSESDKFIEKLMQLTNSGLKEIEYDVLIDNSLMVNTPLSKIVTRLGFVGIKRDLFFPRTSKSRVLFRKYLTLDDLFSMNMTIEDLSDNFNNIN